MSPTPRRRDRFLQALGIRRSPLPDSDSSTSLGITRIAVRPVSEDNLSINPSSTTARAAHSLQDVSTLSSEPHMTIDEAKAQANKHSPMYDGFIAVFNGFTSLVKLVKPCLEGTPFQAPAEVFTAIVEAFEVCSHLSHCTGSIC
jgi:hypothetical protein